MLFDSHAVEKTCKSISALKNVFAFYTPHTLIFI